VGGLQGLPTWSVSRPTPYSNREPKPSSSQFVNELLDVRGLVVAMAPAVAFDVPVEAEGCAVLHLGWEGVRLARRCYLFEEGRNLADLDAIRLENLVEGSVAKTIWLCGWLVLFLLWCGSPDACAASPWAPAASGV
jgi:hypothetical protein